MSRKKKSKKRGRLKRRPLPKGLLKVDGICVGAGLKEKQILYHCLLDLIPQLEYMHAENIKKWLIDAVTFAFHKQLTHYRVKRLLRSIKLMRSHRSLVQRACDLILYAEGCAPLPNFGVCTKHKDPLPLNPERVSIWEHLRRGEELRKSWSIKAWKGVSGF